MNKSTPKKIDVLELPDKPHFSQEKGTLRYEQGADFLKKLIVKQKLKKGIRLPSVRTLSKKLGFSMMTTLKILEQLETEGLVCRIHGKGTFLNWEQNGAYRVLFFLDHFFPKTSHDSLYHDILVASQHWFTKHNYHFLTSVLDKKMDTPLDSEILLGTPRPSGLILGMNLAEKWVNMADSTGLPVVGLNRLFPKNPQISSVLPDSEYGAQLLAKHLWTLGHRKVILLCAQISGQKRHAQTISGFSKFWQDKKAEKFLKIYDIDYDDLNNVDPQYDYLLTNLLKSDQRPTAIVGCTVYSAAQAYRIIQRMGFDIPNDISVVGITDMPLATQLNPKLTTICTFPEKIGMAGAEHLNAIINGIECRGKLILTPVELILRESTAVANTSV